MASTWEIEYRGQLADGASGGDKRSLSAWGLASFDLSVLNLDRGNLSLVVSGETPFAADLPWAYRDKIILWRNGARYWHGWLTREPRAAQPEADSISLVFGDPYWWLDQTTMTDPKIKNVVLGNVSWEDIDLSATISGIRNVSLTWAEPSGDIVWSNWRDQARYTVQGQIRRAYYAAARTGAPIALGTIGIDAAAPAQESAGNTALDYLRGAVAYEPLAVGWWDYSAATPVLHVQPRSALSTISYDLAGCPFAVQCEPLRELQANAVTIRWHYTDEDGDDRTYSEHAGPAELTGGPNVLVLDASVSDYEQRVEAVSYGIAAHLLAALGPLAYAGSLSLIEDISALATARPGLAINLAGGRTEWATMAGVIQQVTLSVVAEAESLTVTWGAPRHLGIGEWLDISRHAGAGLVGAVDPDRLPDGPSTSDPQPGTYDDLNGGTGGGTPEGSIAVQSRGGTWTKKGFEEFPGHVSTPPRRYLSRTPSGAAVLDCPTSLCIDTISGSGSAVYNPATDTISPLSLTAHGLTADSTSGIPPQVYYSGCNPGLWQICYGYVSATRAEYWHGRLADCAKGSDGWYCVSTGKYVLTQGNEDTEDAAIGRMLATADWGGATTAIRTIPLTGITGVYREARYRTEHTETAGDEIWVEGHYLANGSWSPGYYRTVTTTATLPTLIGLSPWQRYQVTVTLESRPVDEAGSPTGDGSWSAAGTRRHYFIADIEGVGGFDWQIIEPTAGYETRVASTLLEVA